METTLLDLTQRLEQLEQEVRVLWNIHSQSGELPPKRPLTLAEQGRLMMERAKRNAAYESFLLGQIFDEMGITGDKAINRKELQRLYREAGFNPEANEFAQGIIDMREE